MEIVLEEQGDYNDVMVRDNGTGIENMDAASPLPPAPALNPL